MIYLIFIGVLLGAIGTYLGERSKKRLKGYDAVWPLQYSFCAVIGWGVSIIATFVVLVAYFSGWSTVGKLQYLHDVGINNFVVTISQTKEAVVKLDHHGSLITISVENLSHSTNISDRILDLRKTVNWYNNEIYLFKRWNSNWFLDSLYPDLPDDLGPIKMQDLKASE